MQDIINEQEFFDKRANLSSVKRKSYEKVLKQFNKFIDIKSYNAILEVGCGNGIFTEVLYSYLKKSFTAIDISSKAIANARKKLPKVKFFIDNIENSKLSSKKFNTVILSGVLHHFKNKERIIAEIKRILKKDGVILGYDPNMGNPLIRLFRSKNSFLYLNKNLTKNEEYFNSKELYNILNNFGFMNIRIESLAGIKYSRDHFKNIVGNIFSFLVYIYNFFDYITEKVYEKKYGQWLIYYAKKND